MQKLKVDENALGVAQTSRKFSKTDYDYSNYIVHSLQYQVDMVRKREFLTKEFDQIRLKSFTQSFTYNNETGYNVMGVLRAPRADGTESIVISAPWTCGDGQDNSYGIGLLMSLAQFAARESMWAKDLIFLVLDKTPTGSLAWLNSYHGLEEQGNIIFFLKFRIKI